MVFARGMRDKVSKYLNPANDIVVHMGITGNSVYDFCCFGVDKDGQLSDDRYMVFYNQTSTPQGEIIYNTENTGVSFKVNLNRIPQTIDKLVFTASIDGNGTMGDISSFAFSVEQSGSEGLSLNLSGSDFKTEKAIIAVEIYRKDEWRISAVANGFNGGLSALLAFYGGTEISSSSDQHNNMAPSQSVTSAQAVVSPQPVAQPQIVANGAQTSQNSSGKVQLRKTEEQITQEIMGKISLSKDKVKLEKHVVSLSKCVVDLSKKSGVDLGSTRAKVVVVLDYSGSMSSLYSNGTIQRTIDKLVPLGLTFDDNGSIDVYLFQNTYRKMDDLNLTNYERYIKTVVETSGYTMGGTAYAPVLKAIIQGGTHQEGGFLGFGAKTVVDSAIVDNGDPTFILFITDGENADRNATDDIIRKSSEMNVFIQFIGIGNERFTYLMKLDDMPGRKRDNTGFSKMKDLDRASDSELYTNVLEQFSGWLNGLQ